MKDDKLFPDTKDKLKESKFFLNQMICKRNDADVFRFYVSAFLSAAESVVGFLSIEANGSARFNSWREKAIKKLNEDKFKKIIHQQRRSAIHRKSIRLDTDCTVYAPALKIESKLQLMTVSTGAGGNLIFTPVSVDEAIPIVKASPEASPQASRRELVHYFKGHREKDVVSICKDHCDKLNKLIQDCENEFEEKK